jgi:arylsulfatase A-like enzyme
MINITIPMETTIENLNRKTSISLTLLLCLLFVSCVTQTTNVRELSSTVLPNIVLIYADDMGYGEIEALNPDRSKIPTPHLNRLVSQGKVFTDAHNTSSVCTPSRYALMTGRYNWRTRLQHGVVTGGNKPLIAKGRLTVPALLKQAGYTTAMVGKWHLEHEYKVPKKLEDAVLSKRSDGFMPAPYPIGTKVVEGPITRGFDSYVGFHHSREMSSIVRNDVIEKEINVVDVLPSMTNEVIKLLDEIGSNKKDAAPFFLYYALNSPHTPIVPSKEWQGKTALGDYGDFVAQTDGSAGAVLEALDRNGLAENTLVIFSTDNGTSRAANIEFLNENGHFPSAHFRGSKADIWDGGHRVPFIVRWPGVTTPGSQSDQLICLSDMIATLAELVAIDLPDNVGEDSYSFLSALKGEQIENPRQSIVHHSINGRFAIRDGDWKLIFAPGSGGWSAPNDIPATEQGLPEIQLYNLGEDIEETYNLYDSRKDKVASMTALLQKIVADGRSTQGPIQANDAEIDIFKTAWNSKMDKEY